MLFRLGNEEDSSRAKKHHDVAAYIERSDRYRESLAEIVEYILGFAISTSLAVFSIFALSGAAPILARFISNSGHAQVVDAARQAVLANTTRSVSLNLSDTSIVCSHGLLTVTGGSGNYSSEIGSDCSFTIAGLSGTHTLTFAYDGRQLRARTGP